MDTLRLDSCLELFGQPFERAPERTCRCLRNKKFYKVFDKLWNSGYEKERCLAVYSLQLYKDDFDNSTWKFLKPKLKDIQDKEQLKSVREISKEIIKKNPKLEKKILKYLEKNESKKIRS